jgi:hypothetical protein
LEELEFYHPSGRVVILDLVKELFENENIKDKIKEVLLINRFPKYEA